MSNWWNNISFLEQIFYYCAIPATLILVIQTLLTILGIGNTDVDIDFDGNVDTDVTMFDSLSSLESVESNNIDFIESASNLKFFSIRGIVAFFTLFGWVGAILANNKLNVFLVFLIAIVCGFIGMFFIAFMFYSISKMQRKGNINIKNAVGKIGQVYIPIPANKKGKGKIQITIQERYTEIDAMTNNNQILSTGTMVVVVDVIDINTLLVEKQE